MKVKAAPGLLCPVEGNPRQKITDDPKGTEVADSPYYRRLIGDGSLELVTQAPARAAAAPKGGTDGE